MRVEVRERRDGDLGALVGVAARVRAEDEYPIHLPGDDYERFLTRPASLRAWVLEQDGAVVGHVALNPATSAPVMELAERHSPGRKVVFVARLLVDPEARRRGHGARLLAHAASAARADGRVALLDVVDIPSAAPAIALYRHLGWEEIGRTPFRLPGNAQLHELVFRAPHDERRPVDRSM